MSQEQPPSEEELRAQLEEELKRVRVEDVLVQSAVTLVNEVARAELVAGHVHERDGHKLGAGDLEQARLGIEGARGLVGLLPDEPRKAVQEALAQLQMMYARAAGTAPPPAGEPPTPGPANEPETKPPSRIWTPPGT